MQYFAKAKERGIGDKPTAEANKRVAEVLERQRLGQSARKRKAAVHSEEAQAKIGKYASTSNANSHELNHITFLGIIFNLKLHEFSAA